MIKILVIDDEIGNRHTDYHQDFVKKFGGIDLEFIFCDGRNKDRQYDVKTVLQFVYENPADIILLDKTFGDNRRFGLQVLERIKINIPILMHTSEADQEVRKECLARGATGLLRKGVSVEEFRNEILRISKGGEKMKEKEETIQAQCMDCDNSHLVVRQQFDEDKFGVQCKSCGASYVVFTKTPNRKPRLFRLFF